MGEAESNHLKAAAEFSGAALATELESMEAGLVRLTEMAPTELEVWFGAENIHNGSQFLSREDNAQFQHLCEADLKQAINYLHGKWAEYADREFIESFELVHWVSNSERGLGQLNELMGEARHEVEISTQGYRDETSLIEKHRWMNAKFGVIINGQVNLASNADIQTNQWRNLQQDDGVKQRKYTEWANRLMTSEANCVSPYEFAVGDWIVTAILVDPDTSNIDDIVSLASRYGIPVIDTHSATLFTKSQELKET